MEERVLKLMRQSTAIGEICTGAYGYLSALVDNYLHSTGGDLDALRDEFHELQTEVTRNIERILQAHGSNSADVINEVLQECDRLDIPHADRPQVVSLALDYTIPGRRVTGL